MNIVIAGAGSVGKYLAKMLAEDNHDLTIIDTDEDRLAEVSEDADVVAVSGSPTSIQTLEEAKVGNADIFIAVYPDKYQDINIVSALLAKKLGAGRVAARVNNAEYLVNDRKVMFTELGIDLLFYPEKMAAQEITDLLKQAEMSEYVGFSHGRLQLLVLKLQAEAPLIDKSTADFNFDPANLPFRAVAITRGDETFIPDNDTVFRLNDLLYIVARKDGVQDAVRYCGRQEFDVRRLTILGGGKIGEMVAAKFEKSIDHVKLIELDRNKCEQLSARLKKTVVVNGDGRDTEFLYQEEIRNSDAFIAVTSSSETNILACVAAKRMGVATTIAEVENNDYIKLAEDIGVDAIINKKRISAGRIFRFTSGTSVRTIKCMSGSNSEVLEYIANPDSKITKGALREIDFPEGAIVGGVIRGTEAFVAVGDTRIKAYDHVAVFSLPGVLKKVDKFFI